MNIDTNGFAIGDTVRDDMTGLVGKISAFTQYATGCVRCAIQAPVDKDGKVPDSYWTDVLSISIAEDERNARPNTPDRTKGGPPAGYASRSDPRHG